MGDMSMAENASVIGIPHAENKLRALRPDQGEILGQFSPKDQQTIRYRQQVLSSLAYFIGKDFRIPVELNEPGAGWYWDFGKNEIRIDPADLVEKPMDYLRFVISHEGGHRRISRAADIPREVWDQPGFAFMSNAIEDPRNNNFIAEAYPKSREQMKLAYELEAQFEQEAKAKAGEDLGFQPKFMQAGFEYIKQWFAESQGLEPTTSEDLPDDVRTAIEATIDSARSSWLTYPSRQEADRSEDLIKKYANASYELNRDRIWPEFKKLVDEDMKDERMQEMLKQMQGQEDEGGVPQDLKEGLNESEQQELEQALENAKAGQGEAGDGKPAVIDLNSLSDGLKQKIKDFIDSLPEEVKEQLEKKAQEALRQYEQELNEKLQGELSDNPDKKAEREAKQTGDAQPDESDIPTYVSPRPIDQEEQKRFRELLQETMRKDETAYEKVRREVLPLIDSLESDLREIFVERRANNWQGGFKTGKRIDIKRRMQEKARGISAVESKAWQKRELPKEKDYAITLLVDLSGSMRGPKIAETFKGAILLAEVLNRLSIQTEILGFNDQLYEYQSYGENMGKDIREHMGSMKGEVHTEHAAYNDDGWALTSASERLARQKPKEKFIFVLSDGQPAESSDHPRSRYDLETVIGQITQNTDQKLIGLGIGQGTEHVGDYYPYSVANIGVRQMAESLADVIRQAIANYGAF